MGTISIPWLDVMSAKQIFDLERFCGEPKIPWNSNDKQRIISEYGLHFNNSRRLYQADHEAVFEELQKRYKKANEYKNYMQMLYAMKYGDIPCKTWRE